MSRIPCVLLVVVLVCLGGVACTDKSEGLALVPITPDPGGSPPVIPPGNPPGNPGNPPEPGPPLNPGVKDPNPGEPIPEPGTMLILGTGLASVAVYHRRRQRRRKRS